MDHRGLLLLLVLHLMTAMDPGRVAQIEELVQRRTTLRRNREYVLADEIKVALEIKFNVVLKDFSYKEGGHTTWSLQRSLPSIDSDDRSLMMIIKQLCVDDNPPELLDAVRRKLRHAVAEFEMSLSNSEKPLSEREMLGRKFADAALHLAMAGVSDESIYGDLVKGCAFELQRIGLRSSCRSVDICQMMERMAAAGVRDSSLYALAGGILRHKPFTNEDSYRDMLTGDFSLLSVRPLNVLYQLTSKQHKFGNQFSEFEGSRNEGDSWDLSWKELYQDPALPLMIDLGCGYGVNLIALASEDKRNGNRFNFLGCDLSPQSLRYAQGISSRWNLSTHLAFVRCDALGCVRRLSSYPGPILWAFLNFPTPYQLDAITSSDEHSDLFVETADISHNCTGSMSAGNQQLPKSMEEFMVTKELVEELVSLLVMKTTPPCSGVMLQSNVEDVALFMEKIFRDSPHFNTTAGLRDLRFPVEAERCWNVIWRSSETSGDSDAPMEWFALTRPVDCLRQQRWVELGGRRVSGPPWLPRNPLRSSVRTETEAAYELEGRPVFRTVFVHDAPR